MKDRNENISFYKHILCHPANNKSVFHFSQIHKSLIAFNFLTNPVFKFYIFHLSFTIAPFSFGNKYSPFYLMSLLISV